MSKQTQKSEVQINKIISFAENLRKKFVIPSLQLENFLNFQYSEIVQKSVLKCCTVEKTTISKAFKRAFRTMNRTQQAQYYSECVKCILSQIHSVQNGKRQGQGVQDKRSIQLQQNAKRFQQLTILFKKQGSFKKWIISKVEISRQMCVLRLVLTGQQLDLNYYLLRESSSKNKPSLVLESTQQIMTPNTLRISNYTDSLPELRSKLKSYIDKAVRMKVSRLLRKNRLSLSTDCRNSIKPQMFASQQQMKAKPTLEHESQNQSLPATLLLAKGINAKSMRQIISGSSLVTFPQQQYKKLHTKLISHERLFALSSFKDFQQILPNVYFNKKQQTTRRIFTFQQDQINYEWLVTQMNCYKMFKKWKSCLFLINLLAELPQQKTKIYHQINLYKDYTEVDYVYLRHLFEVDGVNYYIDKSIDTEEYGLSSNVSRGNIEYCIWRFRKTKTSIEILVQIQLRNVKTKNIAQIAIEYIGNVYLLKEQYLKDKRMSSLSFKTVHNANLFLFEDQSQFNAQNSETNSPFKKMNVKRVDSNTQPIQEDVEAAEKKAISEYVANEKEHNQIINQQGKQNIQEAEFPSFLDIQNLDFRDPDNYSYERSMTQYFSIDQSGQQSEDKQSDEIQNLKEHLDQEIALKGQSSTSHSQIETYAKCPAAQQRSLQECPQNKKYLIAKHQLIPIQNDKQNKVRVSCTSKGHFLWRKQWRISDKGQLLNINQEQIKAQSSVLKLVLKKMGRNLLTGKSVLNISLPIQIFGTDSNLQRLCKSMAYAPKFLQAASKLQSPVERMKRVICFALGNALCYIEMQKPFNPILGETYQGAIDGCMVYGEQTSHHPPISTVFLKGRGYFVYGSLEAKVQMRMNSASGANEGFMNVVFSNDTFDQNVVKFTCPPGQISGLVYGERKLSLIRKTYYIDEKNMIFSTINWGSQKKKNQMSFNNDYLQGAIVKLKPKTDLSKLDRIKETDYQKILSQVKGRWTQKIHFDDQVLFDVGTQGPYQVQQCLYPLVSNVNFRQDLKLRKQSKLSQAQQAKENLQQIQRNDRKLRKNYQKNH